MSKTTNTFAPEVRQRAIRIVLEREDDYPSRWTTITSVAQKIGCSGHTLLEWVKKSKVDASAVVCRRRPPRSSRHRRVKSANCGKPMRFCARRRHISPRRSSTARSNDDRLYRQASRCIWGRADLQGSADRPSTYCERLAEAGIEPSVGSVGDSYDNALAETINGLYKAEVIHRRGPWLSFEAVEYATLEWVDWCNNRCLWSRSKTSLRSKPSSSTMPSWTTSHWLHNLRRMASDNPGAVQNGV